MGAYLGIEVDLQLRALEARLSCGRERELGVTGRLYWSSGQVSDMALPFGETGSI